MGGDPHDPNYNGNHAIVVGSEYFDHYDVVALSSALYSCFVGTRNTAAEVEMAEADIFHAATALAGLATEVSTVRQPASREQLRSAGEQ